MRILIVAPHVPYPGVPHAGGAFLLRHLERLSETCDVALLVAAPPGARDALDKVPSWLRVHEAPPVRPPAWSPSWMSDRVYHRLHDIPPSPSPESLRGLLAAGLVTRARDADVVELHWSEYARLAALLRRAGVGTPLVAVTHDVDAEVLARRARAYGTRGRRLVLRAMLPWHRRCEQRGLNAANLVLAFKPGDAALIRRLGVRTPVRVIDPSLDLPAEGAASHRAPGAVLFTGALWRRENDDGAVWFLHNVWPAVRSAFPGATFTLAGAGPSSRLRAAAGNASDVVITGEVPDLLPYYLQASVFVAPLQLGGGLKFKVPQALVCGLPVVCTSVAAEGVVDVAPSGTLWAVADRPADMAQRVIAALREPEEAAACGHRAAVWARQHWSFERSTDQLVELYADLVHGAPKPR